MGGPACALRRCNPEPEGGESRQGAQPASRGPCHAAHPARVRKPSSNKLRKQRGLKRHCELRNTTPALSLMSLRYYQHDEPSRRRRMLPGKHARACAFQPKAKRGRERHPRHEPPRPHGEGPRVPPRETRSGHADRLHTQDTPGPKARRDLAKVKSCLPEHSKPHTRLSITQ